MQDRTADNLNREANAARTLIESLQDEDEILRHDMVEGETSFLEAIDAALAEIDECDVIAEGCKAKEEQFAARRQKAIRRRDRVRVLIEQAIVLADLSTVKRDSATLTVKRVEPKPIYDDESLIPARFWEPQPPKLDKKAVALAIKDGEDVPGVTMTNGGTTLQIRRV